jgi:hypothetical protein
MNTEDKQRYLFKSVPIGLMLTIFFGPIGLLYASLRGGIIMILIGIILISYQYFFPILLWWIACCVWCVYAIEKYNKKQSALFLTKPPVP